MKRKPTGEWLDGTAHSHTYFYQIDGITKGSVGPNPRSGRGDPVQGPWECYLGNRRIGDDWSKREAMETVEAAELYERQRHERSGTSSI